MKGKILLTRVDNRLVHGQVGVTWTNTIGANVIIVVDEASAHDRLQQKLMESVAKGSGASIRFFTLEEFVEKFDNALETQRIFIVVKEPQVVLKMVEAGIPIQEVNIGNMHYSRQKKQVTNKVYVNEEEIDALDALQKKGIHVYIQDVPGTMIEKIADWKSLT